MSALLLANIRNIRKIIMKMLKFYDFRTQLNESCNWHYNAKVHHSPNSDFKVDFIIPANLLAI